MSARPQYDFGPRRRAVELCEEGRAALRRVWGSAEAFDITDSRSCR